MASVELVSFACRPRRLSQAQAQLQHLPYLLVPPLPLPLAMPGSSLLQLRLRPDCGLVSLAGKLVKKLLMRLLPTGCRRESDKERVSERERETERGALKKEFERMANDLPESTHTNTRTAHMAQ